MAVPRAPEASQRTFEDPHGRGIVVDSASRTQGSCYDLRRWDKVVGEGVVQVSLSKISQIRYCGLQEGESSYLKLEGVLDRIEFVLVSAGMSI